MNSNRLIVLVIAVMAAGFGGYLFGQSGFASSTESSPESSGPASEQPVNRESNLEDRDILYWQAPMNPEEIYDQPGKSAMGMDLVPVYAEYSATPSENDSGSMVSIDPVTVQNMAIRTEHVRQMDFSRSIRTVGEVMYDEEHIFEVNTRISGWIEKLHVNFVGEEVVDGDPLLEIYSPELVTTQEEYLLALRNLENAQNSGSTSVLADAKILVTSALRRLNNWDIPVDVIESLRQTGQSQRTVLLRAPATGIVTIKNAVEGAHIDAGNTLFQIADLTTVWVHASFYENEVPWIVEGQPVEMDLSYVPGKTYTGTVSYVYPYLREKARDVHVRLVFKNPNLDLKPGMYANIQLEGRVIADAIVIPAEAVIHSGERTVVFVDRGNGKFEPREVRIGEEGGPGNGFVRVLNGLVPHEPVVVSAQFMLDSESRLQEAIRKMLDRPETGQESIDEIENVPDAQVHDHGSMGADAGSGMDSDMDSKSDSTTSDSMTDHLH